MNFFQDLRNSIYNPKFYRELLVRSFGYSLAYYAKLSAVLALLVAIFFSLTAVPQINRFIWQAGDEVLALYPTDLQLQVVNGRLVSNEDKVVVSWPTNWQIKSEKTKNLLVLDITASSTVEALTQADTLILLTADSLVFRNDQNRLESVLLKEIEGLKLGEAEIKQFFSLAKPWFKLVAPIMVLVVFGLVIFMMLVLLLPLVIVSLFAYILLRLMEQSVGLKVSWKTSYRLCLHAVTLPLVVGLILPILGLASSVWVFMGLILLVLFWNFQTNTNWWKSVEK
ncbi:MAG: DUF1189 family protein [Patescibacteria group bacterium]